MNNMSGCSYTVSVLCKGLSYSIFLLGIILIKNLIFVCYYYMRIVLSLTKTFNRFDIN